MCVCVGASVKQSYRFSRQQEQASQRRWMFGIKFGDQDQKSNATQATIACVSIECYLRRGDIEAAPNRLASPTTIVLLSFQIKREGAHLGFGAASQSKYQSSLSSCLERARSTITKIGMSRMRVSIFQPNVANEQCSTQIAPAVH